MDQLSHDVRSAWGLPRVNSFAFDTIFVKACVHPNLKDVILPSMTGFHTKQRRNLPMKLLLFDDYKLGVLSGDQVIDASA
ncbi:MAG: hypothetical protein KDE54_12060, partial [Caldilineaceae bacterium]|nr:hypothetical protein [Caldilineaceae bacterium]